MNENFTTGMGVPNYGRPQQAQMQYYVYIVNSRDEAERWPVGPGNVLIFRQIDGSCMYVKSLGLSMYDKPVFEVFPKAIEQAPSTTPIIDEEYKKIAESNSSAITRLTEQFDTLREEVSKLREMKTPKYDNRNKGGRN